MTENNSMVMPVAPAYGGGYGGGLGFGSDIWLIIIILFAMGGFGGMGWGGMGGFGGFGGMYEFPWLLNGQQNILNGVNANTNSGFNQLATQNALGDISNSLTSGFGNVQTSLCGGFAGVNATINGAQNAIAQQLYGNQIADLERSYAAQTATTQGMNSIGMSLQNCCFENRAGIADLKYTVATENCADRTQAMQNTRDIIESQTRSTQAVLDKLCQLELDGVKAQVEAKNDRIAELQTQLNMANLAASQTAQNAFIAQGFSNEVDALYNRLNSCPVPTTPVYGRTPIFTCNQNQGCGCGCNGSAF